LGKAAVTVGFVALFVSRGHVFALATISFDTSTTSPSRSHPAVRKVNFCAFPP
jgi:hypothetical protein